MSRTDGGDERGDATRIAALVALCQRLADQHAGVLTTALDVLPDAIGAKGALAYRVEGQELALVAERGLPRKAKPWLARLPLEEETWFVAQRAATGGTGEVASELGGVRDGHSVQMHLAAAGWSVVAALPIGSARQVRAVLVFATEQLTAFSPPALTMLDGAAAALTVALGREDERAQRRDEMLSEARTTELATVGWLASAAAADLAPPLGRLELQLGDERAMLGMLRDNLDELRDADAVLGGSLTEASKLVGELLDLSWDLRGTLREARAVTAQLLSYSDGAKVESIDLGEFVAATVTLLRDAMALRGIELEMERHPSALSIIGRRDAITVLLVQLLQQAARLCQPTHKATGLIRITTASEPTGHVLTFEWSGPNGSGARLGTFDAFLNPRDRGDRAELGLALARRTVLAHNGHIELGGSELGGGLIRVVFPGPGAAARPKRDAGRKTPARAAAAVADEQASLVWIAEDDAMARSLSRALPSCSIKTAHSVEEARTLLAGLAHRPNLVLCDLGLEDGGVVSLHREAEPELASRFVFMTGGVISREVARYVVGSARPTLIKPVPLSEIVSLLALPEQLLSQSPSSARTLFQMSSQPPAEPEGS